MRKRDKNIPKPGRTPIYGIIEKVGEGKFFAITHGVKNTAAISATGRTAREAERRLEQKVKIKLKRESVTIVLTPVTPLEIHQCSLLRAVEN